MDDQGVAGRTERPSTQTSRGQTPTPAGFPQASKRVALYSRVSTEDQAKQGFSLAAQARRLHLFARAQHWIVSGEYVDDGYSGRDVRRPEYERMLRERDRWDAILVLKMDRIHRNSRNFMAMMDDLARSGKDFVSATESLDTSTATGRFVVDMLQRIAQLESEQTGERVHMGMRQAAEEGKFLGMSDPYGYRYDSAAKNLVVVPAEAAVVREIFRLVRDERRSMQAIAETLNARGVVTKRGRSWSKRQVFRVLHSPLYVGSRRWEDVVTPNAHEAIVAPPMAARRRRRARRRDG